MQDQPDIMIIDSKRIPLKGAASSLIGGRPENQDNIGWMDTQLGFLLVVCDGMGGGPGGATASNLATRAIIQEIMACPKEADRANALRKAISHAEDIIEKKMHEVPALNGMGTTVVALLINEESAMIAHLGDSRCYRMRGNKSLFRTNDHSLVGELVRAKALTEEQARQSPQSNVITRGLGNTSNHVAEIDEVPYRRGDRFIACTDGVWGIMPHDKLLDNLGIQLDAANVVRPLQQEVDRLGASEGGNHDNHTLAIIEMAEDSTLKEKMNKQIKIILMALSAILALSIITNIVMAVIIKHLPSKAELQEALNKAEMLARGSSALEQINEDNTKTNAIKIGELEQRLALLEGEHEELLNEYENLYSERDSLAKALENAKTQLAKAEKKPIPSSNQKTGYKIEDSKKIAKNVMQGLNNMKSCNNKDFKIACKIQGNTKIKTANQVRELNALTNKKYKKTLDEIEYVLRGKDVGYIHQKEKGANYTPTPAAMNIIEDLIRKFEKVQKQIIQ